MAEEYLGIRVYAALYITIGAVVGVLGSLVASVTQSWGSFFGPIVGIGIWAVFVFISLIIALKGIAVFVEGIVETTLTHS